MADVTLSNSVITIDQEAADRGYVSVVLVDPDVSTGQQPKGKRVELSRKGTSTKVLAWTNGTNTKTDDQVLASGVQQHTRYLEAGRTLITIRKAATRDIDPAAYTLFGSGVLDFSLESTHAPETIPGRLMVKRWTFTDGPDKVIITIVMQDDEGGGGVNDIHIKDVLGHVVLVDNQVSMRFHFKDHTFLIPIPDITTT